MNQAIKWIPRGCSGGWTKPLTSPVLGPEYGTSFDMQVLKEDGKYRMWFSWRPVNLIGYAESTDGITWTLPRVVFTPDPSSDWEAHEVNRPSIIKKDGMYHMWYTGQMFPGNETRGSSAIGYATSPDGITWTRYNKPVLSPEEKWEGISVMCPEVHWDEKRNIFRMWYSGGEMEEPDAIGYAESSDGIQWIRHSSNPIFVPDSSKFCEMKKVTAGHLLIQEDWHYMFYIGFDGDGRPSCCLARSKDGISGWERHPDNPVIAGSDGYWDHDGVYHVSVVKEDDGYSLWYNGANYPYELIGYARHEGFDLGFDSMPERNDGGYRGVLNLI